MAFILSVFLLLNWYNPANLNLLLSLINRLFWVFITISCLVGNPESLFILSNKRIFIKLGFSKFFLPFYLLKLTYCKGLNLWNTFKDSKYLFILQFTQWRNYRVYIHEDKLIIYPGLYKTLAVFSFCRRETGNRTWA